MLVKDKIRQYRKSLGLDLAQFAEKIGVSQGNVSRYESGYVKKIPDPVLKKMAKVFKCSVNELVKDDPAYGHLHSASQRKELTGDVSSTDDQLILDWFHSRSPELQSYIKNHVLLDMHNAFDQ